MKYPHASTEPLDVIEANECEHHFGELATKRFQACFNEIERLTAELQAEKARSIDFMPSGDLMKIIDGLATPWESGIAKSVRRAYLLGRSEMYGELTRMVEGDFRLLRPLDVVFEGFKSNAAEPSKDPPQAEGELQGRYSISADFPAEPDSRLHENFD